MPTLHHTPFLRRSALALAISLGFAGAVQAQSSEGSLFGRAKPSAAVTVLNTETGATRQIAADAAGNFNFSKLPPGRYRVTSGGQTAEVSVAIGSGTEVTLGAASLERVEVSGRRVRSAIDVSTVESNSVFTAAQIQALPVTRSVNAVAYLAPGVVKGDAGLGDGTLPSFGGASVGENGYYINGFDVTNIRNFLSYANLPFDAIEQQQVKTGGYGAEYGRSLGGVVSIVTKRGTNDWKGGVSAYYEPQSLRSDGKNVISREPTENVDFQNYTLFERDDRKTDLTVNLFGGGPIIKDKLFIFGVLELRNDTTSNFKRDGSTATKSDKPNGMLKLDWTPADFLAVEATAITNKKRTKLKDYSSNDQPFATSHYGTLENSQQTEGGNVYMGKATVFATDNLTFSALVGKVDIQRLKTTGDRTKGADCPVVLETNLNEIGCWKGPFPGVGGPAADARPFDTDKRTSFRLDAEYVIGKHTLRAGLDNQKFVSYEAGGSSYTGGYYYRYFISPNGTVNGVANAVPAGGQYVRRRELTNTSGEFEVLNDAFYIEDSWKITPNVLLYGGVRSESFNNKNGDGVSFVKADNKVAPRIGAAWNVNGDSSLKVYGNYGRYYIPVASNTNIRATRGELFEQRFFPFTGRDSRTQGPLALGAEIGSPQINNDGSLPDPGTIASTTLAPMSQDEFILGFQKTIAKGWSVGVKGTRRKINDGMDDFCGHYAMDKWAADKGYTKAFETIALAPCIIVNPGRDVTLKMDLAGDGKLVEATIPASYFGLEKYKRTYNAIELTLEKPFDGKWGLNASYTWSKSKGTAEGYVQSNLDQEDAGITQDFDFGSFTDGSNGYLPNDRRHVFKAFGTYQVSDTWRVGGNATIASGRPLSCIGFVPTTAPDFAESGAYTSASSYYCLDRTTGRTTLGQRGSKGRTAWTTTFDLQVAYTPKFGTGRLTLQADVFNLFNSQKATELNEVGDFSRDGSNAQPGRLNLNYLNPTSYQDARAVRLSARYEF